MRLTYRELFDPGEWAKIIRVTGLIMINSIVIACAYFIFLNHSFSNLTRLKQHQSELMTQLKQKLNKQQEMIFIKKHYAEIQQRHAHDLAKLNQTTSLNQLLSQMAITLSNNGILLDALKPSHLCNANVASCFHLTASGSYSSIIDFIQFLASSDWLTHIKLLQFTSLPSKALLQLQLEVEVYHY